MYIRTKDGIYKITDCQGEFLLKGDYGNVKWIQTDNETSVAIKDITNQSENLEDLCDVYAVPRFQHIFKIDRFSKNAVENYAKSKDKGIVYGAIWTNKGLIYVAKMNENGELELI